MTTSPGLPPLIDSCLEQLWSRGGSDLLLTVGSRPLLRVDGRLVPASGVTVLAEADTRDAAHGLFATPEQLARFERDKHLDLAFSWRQQARVRANAFHQRGTVALSLRMLPARVPAMHELGLPITVQRWADLPRGLVLVTGPTGSGKSTTLAAIVEHIVRTQPRHVVTIEDPIEYVHAHGIGAVNQREVGVDVHTFAEGLRAVLREDPDVVLIGEMRDPESIEAALTIAETGHLVLATLHTNDTAQTLDRIVDASPRDRQEQIRLQLAHTLTGVLHQLLVRRIGRGRVAAFDVLVATEAVRNLIREGKTRQIRNVVSTAQRDGMQTLEAALNGLITAGLIAREEALAVTLHPEDIVTHAVPPAPLASM